MHLKAYQITLVTLLCALALPALAEAQKPLNFLMIWGDDIGYWNLSAYNRGMMGYRTPNIDRIAQEGMLFTGPRSSPGKAGSAPAC